MIGAVLSFFMHLELVKAIKILSIFISRQIEYGM